MNKQQFREVTKLSAEDRYAHFVEKVVDEQELWTLKNDDGFATMASESGGFCIPFWPHPEYAQSMAVNEFEGCSPVAIPLDAFMEKWLPGMDKDGHTLSVFPALEGQHAVMPASELLEALEAELKELE